MKKKVALVLSGTSNLVSSIACVIINAEIKSPGFIDDVYVFHDKISETDQKALNKYRPVHFIKYENILTKSYIEPQYQYFGLLCYGIFEIFDLLEKYENVIYLDSDVIIKKDFSSIINYGPIGLIDTGKKMSESFKTFPSGVTKDFNTRNTGVVVVNDTLNYVGLTEFCYKTTLEQQDNNLFADQSMLAYCLFLKKINITLLPKEYNRVFGKDYNDIIVHCINRNKKPWNNSIVNGIHPDWNLYYSMWLDLGGSEYTGTAYDGFFKNIKFQNAKDMITISRLYLQLTSNFLDDINKEIIKTLSNKFKKIHYSKSKFLYYYELSDNRITRFEIGLTGTQFTVKIYTNSQNIGKKIVTKYSSLFPKYKIIRHKNGSFSLKKTYSIFDYSSKMDQLFKLILDDTQKFFKETLLSEEYID